MSSSGDPPRKDPPEHPHAHLTGDPMPEAAPPDATEIGSVDELYGAPNPPPPHTHVELTEPSVIVSGEVATTPDVAGLTAPAAPPGPPMPEEPLLPATADENALRDAVGAPTPRRRAKAKAERETDDDDQPVKRNRRMFTIAALTMLSALVIATFVMLGRANRDRFAITCSTDRITPEQGRSFPPWGTQPMTGPEWKPIAMPANAECKPRGTDNQAELEGWYLDLLVERASTALTTPNLLDAVATPVPGSGKPGGNLLDIASDQLDQALLLSRSPERRDQRKEVERLRGDVQYWRASLRLRDAAAALLDASRQFETAAQQRPRHVTDAAAWAQYTKTLADDLRAGPNGAPAAQNLPPGAAAAAAGTDHPSAPMGTALPVETPPETDNSAPAPPDAGVPTGGVLL